ncbi:hypothetical protein [Anaerorhabdus sp.]|uniref:hypothetical protein n=1 Tax=Anaerorhabdus sp. TaxID=1872524 RepID=UPI002FC88835
MAVARCELIDFGTMSGFSHRSSIIAKVEILSKGLENAVVNQSIPCVINYKIPSLYRHNLINEIYYLASEYPNLGKRNCFINSEIKRKKIELGTTYSIFGTYSGTDKQIVNNNSARSDYVFALLGIDGQPEKVVDKSFKLYGDFGSVQLPIVKFNFSNKYVQYNRENVFLIESAYLSQIYDQFIIVSGVFKYREKGSVGVYNQIEFDGDKVTLPQNTLSNNKVYECYTTCTVDDGQKSDSQVVELTTVDSEAKVLPISPNNEITYGEVEFSWNYINDNGSKQYAYDLQISTDGLSFNDVEKHMITEETFLKKEIQGGTLYWRIRAYNQNDVQGEWSESIKFVNFAKPTKPSIQDVLRSGRPTVYWDVDNQSAFEFEIIGVFNTGQVYSTDKFYRIEKYLPNDSYVCRLRIFNQFAQASDWIQFTYYQNMIVSEPVGFVKMIDNGFKVSIDFNSEFIKYYLLRNDVLIHRFNSNEYDDLFVCGETKYTIRAVDQNDNFSDLVIKAKFKNNKSQLISMNGIVYDLSNRLNNKPVHNVIISRENKMVNFLNREKPNNYEGTTFFKTFSITCSSSFDRLGEVFFYRNYFGDFGFVVCNSITKTNSDILDEIQFNLDVIDFEEGIDYDE